MSYSQQEADLIRENEALKAENTQLREALKSLTGIAPFLQGLSWNPLLTPEDAQEAEYAAAIVADSLAALSPGATQ